MKQPMIWLRIGIIVLGCLQASGSHAGPTAPLVRDGGQQAAGAEPEWGRTVPAPRHQRQALSALMNLRGGGRGTAWLRAPLVIGPNLWNILHRELGLPMLGVPSVSVVPGGGSTEMCTLRTEEDVNAFARSSQARQVIDFFAQGSIGAASENERRNLYAEVPFPLKAVPVTAARRKALVLLMLIENDKITWLEAFRAQQN